MTVAAWQPLRDGRLVPPPMFNFVEDVLRPRALAHPDKIAVTAVNAAGVAEQWSYARVLESSGRLAGALREAGIEPGDRVMLFMPRTPGWLLAMAACLHIGAIPVPCVTQISSSEVAFRLERSGARGVISSLEFASRFDGLHARLPVRIMAGQVPGWKCLEDLLCTPRAIPATHPMPSETPALMYFTSGSSGLPKAVIHAARGVFVRSFQPWHQLRTGADDVIWTTSDTGWTRAGSCLFFGAWMSGATSLIVEPELTPAQKIDLLAQHGVTIYSAVATELRQILASVRARPLPRLRCTISAGEAMTAELARRWAHFSGAPLQVGYGQTETATSTLTDAHAAGVNGMIGRPLDGNHITVLTPEGRPAAAGEHGEIAFAGDDAGLMLGYWSDGTVVRAFRPDGWHMTGDSGYVNGAGELFFVGRSDDIISSAGYRIGPTEVENALIRHPSVLDCAVAASPDPIRGEIVTAHIVLRPGHEGTAGLVCELQDFVKQEIAPYKYPRQIVFLAELPRTPSGKVSRRALRELAAAPVATPALGRT